MKPEVKKAQKLAYKGLKIPLSEGSKNRMNKLVEDYLTNEFDLDKTVKEAIGTPSAKEVMKDYLILFKKEYNNL